MRSEKFNEMLESDTKTINAKGLCGSPFRLKTSQDLLQIVQPFTKKPITPLLEEYDDLMAAQVR